MVIAGSGAGVESGADSGSGVESGTDSGHGVESGAALVGSLLHLW